MHYYTDYEKKKLFALMNKIIELYERREKMEPQMEAMLERLKSVENMEQMINLEDEIAKALGHGFLKGDFKYEYLMHMKESVEQIETERREVLEIGTAEKEKRPSRFR